jgi:Cytochrome C oxidase, cbb3-type, subunit III
MKRRIELKETRIGRRVAVGLVAVACAVALVTPVAIAHRTTAHSSPLRGNIANGFRVFNDYFCASCHVMKAAGPTSYRGYNVCDGDTACNVGVNFNKVHVSYQAAIAVVASGLPAALPLYPTQMPPFKRVLSRTQIRDVAAFLAKYSGGYKTCTECRGITPSGVPSG